MTLHKQIKKLNKQDYFTRKNGYLTNSKIGDFLKSREIYKQKWIDWTYERESTPSLTLGSIVDEYISTGKLNKVKAKWHVKVKKADNPELYEKQQSMNPDRLVTQEVWDKAIKMGSKIVDSNIYYWLKFHQGQFQVLLTSNYDGAYVAGMLDALAIVGDTAYLLDFKTSNAQGMRSAKAWYWHCKDFGYLRQMAHYGQLVKDNYPEVKNIIYRHVVIGSSEEENFPVKIFELDPISLEFDKELEFFKRVAVEIVHNKVWEDRTPTFNEVVILKNPYDDNDN